MMTWSSPIGSGPSAYACSVYSWKTHSCLGTLMPLICKRLGADHARRNLALFVGRHPPKARLAALLLNCVLALWFSIKLDLDIRGRNCDRPVERSPVLEGFDELGALLLGHSLEMKVQPNHIEETQLGPDRIVRIERLATAPALPWPTPARVRHHRRRPRRERVHQE